MEILGQSTKTTTSLPYTHLGYVSACGRDSFWMPLIPGVLLLLVGVLQLRFRRERHRKASIAAIISAFVFLIMSFVMYLNESRIPTSIISSTNLKGLGTVFMVYAREYENKLPSSEKWCDVLISSVDVSPKSFRMPYLDINEGECLYAMNENVSRMEFSKIPADVVLLFETDLGIEQARTGSLLSRPFAKELGYTEDVKIFNNRWNQVGGPEDIKTDYHQRPGINILFGDGHVAFVREEKIDLLKWTVDEDEGLVEMAPQK